MALILLGAVFAVGYLYSIRDKVSARSIRNYWNNLWGIQISTDTLDWNLTDNAVFSLYQGGVLAAVLVKKREGSGREAAILRAMLDSFEKQ